MAGEDPIISGMAGRYANALFELALDNKAVDAVKKDLDQFDALVADSADLNRLVRSPVFGADEQLKALSAILTKAGIAGLTLIAAQELQRYGVTVNCLAPNARTRMTESAFALPDDAGDFDPLDPANMAPVVVALCADEAQAITGQVFHVWGGAVNALRGWSAGELFAADERWDADALLAELVGRYPEGAAPAGMVAGMQAAGGRSLRAR